MFGSTLVALIAVIGIPITMDTIASANWRARPLCSEACARLASWACRMQLCGSSLRKILDPLSEVGGDRFGVFGPEFHSRCESGLGIALQFFARLPRNGPVVRWHRVRGRRIHLVGLKILGWDTPGRRLLRIVLGRVILRWVILWRIVLGRIVLGGSSAADSSGVGSSAADGFAAD